MKVKTKPFAIPAAKSDVEVRLSNPSVAPTPARIWGIDKWKDWALIQNSKYGRFDFFGWLKGFLFFEILQISKHIQFIQFMPVEGRGSAEQPQ